MGCRVVNYSIPDISEGSMKDILSLFTKGRATLGPICLGAVKLGDHMKDNDYDYNYGYGYGYDYDYSYESAYLEFFLDIQTSSWK